MKEYMFRCKNCGHIIRVSSDEKPLKYMILQGKLECPRCRKTLFERVD